jgi:hypothetical protein
MNKKDKHECGQDKLLRGRNTVFMYMNIGNNMNQKL